MSKNQVQAVDLFPTIKQLSGKEVKNIMADEFFIDAKPEQSGYQGRFTQPETPQVTPPAEPPVEMIKLGEKEYTQEQLQKLVGLGEIGLEAESKYKTRIDRVWPQFQSIVNEKRTLEQKTQEYENRIKELSERQTQPQQPITQDQKAQIQQMTPEMRSQALSQLRELNAELGYISKEDAQRVAMDVIVSNNLVTEIGDVIDRSIEDGLPSTTINDMLAHMRQTGIRIPEKAYVDMFQKEYLDRQVEKLAELKSQRNGLPTTTQRSTAGSKTPPNVKVTDSNIEQLLKEAFTEAFQ